MWIRNLQVKSLDRIWTVLQLVGAWLTTQFASEMTVDRREKKLFDLGAVILSWPQALTLLQPHANELRPLWGQTLWGQPNYHTVAKQPDLVCDKI